MYKNGYENMAAKKKDKRVKVQVVEEKTDSKTKPEEKAVKEDAKNVAISADSVDVDIQNAEKVEIENETPEKKEPSEVEKETAEPVTETTDNPDKLPFWVLFLSFLIGVSLGAGLIGGIFYYQSSVDNLGVTEEVTQPTASPKVSDGKPTPSPSTDTEDVTEEEVDLSVYKVQVLNGSGIGGEAAKAEALVVDAGFTNTTTGNADSYSYTTTEIQYKDSVDKRAFSPLEEALDVYVVERTDVLPESNAYDIVIIVGQDKS